MTPARRRTWVVGSVVLRALARVVPSTAFYRSLRVAFDRVPGRVVGTAPAPDLDAVAAHLTPQLCDAASSVGGLGHIEDRIRAIDRAEVPLVFTYLSSSERRRARLVRVEGIGLLEGGPAAPPVVLVVPHLGPYALGLMYLATTGHEVSFISLEDPRDVVAGFDLIEVLAGPNRQVDYILSAGLTAPLRAERALRSGRIVVWQPDTPLVCSTSAKAIDVSFLGLDLQISPALLQVARRVGARLVLGQLDVPDLDRPNAVLTLRELPSYPDEAIEASATSVFGGVEQALGPRIDDWTIWRHYDKWPPVTRAMQRAAREAASAPHGTRSPAIKKVNNV